MEKQHMSNQFKIFCAPLQGFTSWAWRQAHHQIFGGVDAYFAPFIRVGSGEVRRHDLADVLPERNVGVPVVPQILASSPGDVLLMATTLRHMGYSRIDVNLGCPFPPIALHRKGSGMLPYPALVHDMLQSLASVGGITWSVKMRLGWNSPTEWQAVLPMLGIISPCHVTLHARTGREGYRGELHLQEFEQFLSECPFPVIANGEIRSLQQVMGLKEHYPKLAGVMIGRALVANPALLVPERASLARCQQFHDAILSSYLQAFTGGEGQVLRKMQDLWQLMWPDAPHKLRKAIRKAHSLSDYREAVAHIFR